MLLGVVLGERLHQGFVIASERHHELNALRAVTTHMSVILGC